MRIFWFVGLVLARYWRRALLALVLLVTAGVIAAYADPGPVELPPVPPAPQDPIVYCCRDPWYPDWMCLWFGICG